MALEKNKPYSWQKAERGKIYRLRPIPGHHQIATVFGDCPADGRITAQEWFHRNQSILNRTYGPVSYFERRSIDSRDLLFVVDSHLVIPSLTFFDLEGSQKVWSVIKILRGDGIEFYGVDVGQFELVLCKMDEE